MEREDEGTAAGGARVPMALPSTLDSLEVTPALEQMINSYAEMQKMGNARRRVLHESALARARLSVLVGSRVHHLNEAVQAASDARDAQAALVKCFENVCEMCAPSPSASDDASHGNSGAAFPLNDDVLECMRSLSNLRTNVEQTLGLVSTLEQIPVTIDRIEEIIEDDRNVVELYQHLYTLERLELALTEQQRSFPEEYARIQQKFVALPRYRAALEEHLWTLFDDFYGNCKTRPGTMVAAVRVVHMQDRLDVVLSSAKLFSLVRSYGAIARSHMEQWIMQHFDYAFADLETDIALGPDADMEDDPTVRYLTEAETIFEELEEAAAVVAPCFPPEYDIFRYLVRQYHKHFYHLLVRFANQGEEISARDTLVLVQWVQNKYTKLLDRVNLSNIEPPMLEPLESLMQNYRRHIAKLLFDWGPRVIYQDKKCDPSQHDGIFMTDAPGTVFSIISEQLKIGRAGAYRKLVTEVISECVFFLERYANGMIEMLENEWMELSFEFKLAVLNNSSKLMELTKKFGFTTQTLIGDDAPPLDHVLELFGDLGACGARVVASTIFCDLEEPLKTVGTSEWRDAEELECGAVIDTFEDYFTNDIRGFVLENFFPPIVLECLSRLTEAYKTEILRVGGKADIDDRFTARFAEEWRRYSTYFYTYLVSQRVDACVAVIRAILMLMEAPPDNLQVAMQEIDGYVYDGVIPKERVEKLLSRRGDVDRSQRRAALKMLTT